MRLTPSPRTAGHRTRPLDSYRLPETALANPVCGALGSRTELNPVSTTTAPVSGSHFVRGYAGLNDVTWSGQATRYDTSRRLAHLEGLERYAGTHARRGTAPVRASYHQLLRTEGAAAVLDPAACGFYPAETYRSDPLLSPFDPDRELPWLWGYSLRAERRCWCRPGSPTTGRGSGPTTSSSNAPTAAPPAAPSPRPSSSDCWN